MKANYLIFAILTLFISSLYSVEIVYTLLNETYNSTNYSVDIMVKVSEPNTRIGDNQIYLYYNSDFFGEYINGNGVPANDRLNESEVLFSGNPLYETTIIDRNPSSISINTTYALPGSPELGIEIPTVNTLMFNLSVDLNSPSGLPELEFLHNFMFDQQYQSDNTELNKYTYPDYNPLPVTLSTFSGVQDGDCVQLNWVTQSESNNWLWNVYRSDTIDLNNSFQHNGMPIWGAGTTSTPTQYSYMDDEIENIPIVTYYYWLESVDYNGDAELFGPISLNYFQNQESVTAPELKKEGLLTNYPNPFNPNTNIGILSADDTKADLKIYNSKGQLIDTIFKNRNLEKDVYESFYWDGKSTSGNALPNGIYFAKLIYGKKIKTHRMILLK